MGLLVKHILKHPSGRVSYRRVFPPALRPFIEASGGKLLTEHKVSLGQPGSPGFLSRYEAANGEYEAIVRLAGRAQSGSFDSLDEPTIAYLAKVFEIDLHQYEERQLAERGSEWAEQAKHGWEWMLDEFREWRVEGDVAAMVDQWGGSARALLADKHILLAPSDDQSLGKLCRALNDIVIAHAPQSKRRIAGDIVPIPEAPAAPRASRSTKASLPMLPLFDSYAVDVVHSVRKEWRKIVERLIAFLGHDDARRLTTTNLMAWRDVLSSELTPKGALRDPRTVKKYLVPVRAMLKWAVQEQKLEANVADAVVVKVPRKAKVRDRNFTDTEANSILAATLETPPSRMSVEHARARRWIPWLCAYTGARVNEISQLRKEDILKVDDVWMIRITPDAGTVKSKEARLAPIHEHLVEQGFLAVIAGCDAGPIFYAPERQRARGPSTRHYKKVGERIASWVRDEVGIADTGLMPNHAWRHTFKTKAIEVEISLRVVDAIVGHAAKSVGDTYGSVTPKAKAAAIAKFPRYAST